MLSLLKNNKTTFLFFSLVLILQIFLAYLWGWKTSGVLENTMSLSYPEGYRYGLISPKYGYWWVNKESSYYLLAAQGFLGVEGATLNVGCLYEIYRTIYPLLLRSFWFLEPIEAVLVLDILTWFFACIAVWFTLQNLKLNISMQFFAVFFTVFGQGFLQSVGEGMPHIVGYASGYFVLFLLSFFKPWKKEAEWRDDLPIYAFIGIWQLVYGTALFFLPLAVCATFYRYYQNSLYHFKEFFLLLSLALIPYLTMSFFVGIFFKNSGGVCNIVFEYLSNRYTGIFSLLKLYGRVLMDSFLALGPVAIVGLIGLFCLALKKEGLIFKVVFLVCMAQLLVMALLLVPLVGRGYATFNFYPAICLGAAFVLSYLWELKKYIARVCVFMFCTGWILYTHGAKLGFILPSQIFFSGLSNISQPWWGYELHLFQ